MHFMHRASRIALGLMVSASCAAACTLMKPSHDDLSGGEGDPPVVEAGLDATADLSQLPDTQDAQQTEAEPDAADAPQDVKNDDAAAEADAPPDGPGDAMDEPDAEPLTCDAGGKVCQNACVAIDDPDYGCGQTTCQPCALASADAGCQNGKCSVGACNSGYSNCDDAAVNGCESNKQTDPDNCGTCGNACTAPLHMVSECVAGSCAAPVCAAGWSDCDADGGVEGCETATGTDPDNCGACGNVCADGPNGTRKCSTGKCALDCAMGWDDCDGDVLTGCEASVHTDVANCGACANECTYAHGIAKCTFGVCQLAMCEPLWGDCNNAQFDGCERDLSSDKLSCGTCWHKCVGGQNCVSGKCI